MDERPVFWEFLKKQALRFFTKNGVVSNAYIAWLGCR